MLPGVLWVRCPAEEESQSFRLILAVMSVPVFMRAVCASLPRDDSSDRSRQFDETGAVRRANGRSRRSILLLSLRAVVYRKYFWIKTAVISTLSSALDFFQITHGAAAGLIVNCALALGDVVTVDRSAEISPQREYWYVCTLLTGAKQRDESWMWWIKRPHFIMYDVQWHHPPPGTEPAPSTERVWVQSSNSY